jgi:hypothetical protein
MDFRKISLIAFAAGIGVFLSVFAVSRLGAFSKRVANSIAGYTNAQDAINMPLFDFWCVERELHALRTATPVIKKTGMIDIAVISTLNKEGHKSLEVGYLSNDANIKEIIVRQGEDIILSVPPPTRKYAKRMEKYYVSFEELLVWRTPDNPFADVDAGDLSITLVKDDGKIIGPARILSDKDVWEEIRDKMLAEKKWQDKFPWLYERLKKDPDMSPLWRDPDKIMPDANQPKAGGLNKQCDRPHDNQSEQ